MFEHLAAIPGVLCRENALLRDYTRFAIGGPARLLADAATESGLLAALECIRTEAYDHALIGGGSNLVASAAGFPGVVWRFTGKGLQIQDTLVRAGAGVLLQD